MTEIKLRLPLRDIKVNQPFGVNYVDFYTNLGLKGHNGIDFAAKHGCPVYASHDGEIQYCGEDNQGGRQVTIWNKQGQYKTIYYHLLDWTVKQGQQVKAGDLIAHADNTGIYTTGDHLHFGFKFTDVYGSSINMDNGYNGATDPSPYFCFTYNGIEINNKDWDKSRCYHRYYRGRPKGGLYNETKVLAYLGLKGIMATSEMINALVYGGWDLETVKNPAMYEIYSQLKKYDEYLKGQKPFC